MTLLQFGDEGARRIERVYATPDVVEQRRQVLDLLRPVAGEEVSTSGPGPASSCARSPRPSGPRGPRGVWTRARR